MKTSITNKVILALMFILPAIIVIAVFLIGLKPWENYSHNGPLAYPKNKTSQMTSPKVQPAHGVIFGGFKFINKTDQPAKIISIKPSNLSGDITFKALGVSDQGISTILTSDLSANTIKKLPFKIPAGSTDYQPVVELKVNKPGTYSMDGLIITYEWNGKTYREFYSDQFIVECER